MLGREEFYNVTKLLHNALQGNPQGLTPEQWQVFAKYNEMNAQELAGGWDVIIVHDPQPAAIHQQVPEKSKNWIWRCHIDLSTPNPTAIERLVPLIRSYDGAVFHLQDYVPGSMDGAPVHICPPAIDPLSPKNMAFSPEDASYVCDQFGIDVDRPLMCQVSRFDPWKDPMGVIDAYRLVKEDMPEVQLALIGSMATDDPEGWEFFNQTMAHAEGDPDVHILNNLNNVGAIEVNAFQSQSDVVIQKSTREGFGLTVSEALWKARPFIGGRRRRHPPPGGRRRVGLPRLVASGVRRARAWDPPGPGSRQASGAGGEGACAPTFPHPTTAARLAAYLQEPAMNSEPRLVLVSNRGPATFGRSDSGELVPSRGGGGLVTALTGLVHHRDALWIASTLSDEDAEAAREHGGGSFDCELDGTTYRIRLVESETEAYDRFYNVVANPMLWFIQHYLWDLSNAPDIRQWEVDSYEDGYCAVNRDLADAVLEEIEGDEAPIVMLHDYHLYAAPKFIRESRPDAFLHHFVHIPWTQPDAWRVLPRDMREDIFEGILSNDIVAFHTRAYRRNFLLCCQELFDLEVDDQAGIVRFDDREIWVRAYPLPISAETFRRNAQRAAVHEYEREILRRRREHLILRVDRADLSKNVLRGFAAFDLFLEQHPEFNERVTFIAHLIPSRQDVPEYAEYLERIEALVAVVNHRHGTTDWMPIDLKLRENLEEAIAAYKHYDLLMVNAMFDGMNLIAKEGPLVNERHGVSLLSENTGAHEELAEFALSVNPFDVQEQADAIHRALTMSADERSWRAEGLKRVVEARDPGDWVDDQIADIEGKRLGRDRVRSS